MSVLVQTLHDPFWQFIIGTIIALTSATVSVVSVIHQFKKTSIKAKVPHRYNEVITYSHSGVFSDGYLYQDKDTYESLRSALLYYAGQYVTQDVQNHFNYEAAENYRDKVLQELGVR